MTRHNILPCVTALAALLWLVAQPAPAHATRVLKYDIQQATSFVVTAYADQDTILAFPSAVEYAIVPNMSRTPAHADFVPFSHEVKLTPRQKGTGGDGFVTIITEKQRIHLLLHLVDRTQTEAYDRIEFYDGHAERLFIQEQCQRRFKTAFAHMSFRGLETTEIRHDPGNSTNIELVNPRMVRLAETHQFHFAITNHHYPVLPIQTIRIIDGDRKSEHTEFLEIDSSSSDPKLIAEIPKGDTVAVFLEVDDIEHLGPTAYLEIVTAEGIPMATKTIYPFGDPYKKDPPNKGRISVRLEGLAGAISLANPDVANRSEVTVLGAVGVRAVYGISDALSLEGALSVASTGDAEFEDNMTVDATSARILAAAAVHTGTTFVPYLKAGGGARISNYNADRAGDMDSSLQLHALVTLGGGLDIWFGDRFVLGLSAIVLSGIGGEAPSLEAGAQLGYAWKSQPKRN